MPPENGQIKGVVCDPSASAYCGYLDSIAELYDANADDPSWGYDVGGNEDAQVTTYTKDFSARYLGTVGDWSFRIGAVWNTQDNSLSFMLFHRPANKKIAQITVDSAGNAKATFGNGADLNYLRSALIALADISLEPSGCFMVQSSSDIYLWDVIDDHWCDTNKFWRQKHTIGAEIPRAHLPSLEIGKQRLLAEKIGQGVDKNYHYYERLYQWFHEYPEIAHNENLTSIALAEELKKMGFEVTENFAGYGLVAILRNGEGPTALVRAEMDALSVQEETGLPYQSLKPGVMHACGHDVHMSVLLGTAHMLTEFKDKWRGTLIFVGQPAEETGEGARAMLDAGLFKVFPKPDYALSVHVSSSKPVGVLSYREGYALANVDYVDVIFTGPGGHGAVPAGIANPIELASRFLLDLNAFVTEVNKSEPAVVSVGSFHGGTEHNIIPKEVRLQMTIRSFKPEVREWLKNGIQRLATDAAAGAGAPGPRVEYMEGVPSLYNDPALVGSLAPIFKMVAGDDNVIESSRSTYGDDFAFYGYETGVPIFQFGLGVQPGDVDSKNWPRAHSPKFAPQFEDAFKLGVQTMVLSIIELQSQSVVRGQSQ